VRVRLSTDVLRPPLVLEEVRAFQPGSCWIWCLDEGILIEGPTLRIYAGWICRCAWPLLSSFIEGGRIVWKTDLVAKLEAVEPPFPRHLFGSRSKRLLVLPLTGE
jgi:hypothetical protein